jgi:hypothetical protein
MWDAAWHNHEILNVFTTVTLTNLGFLHILVVNDQRLAEANALPARSSAAPVSIVAIYLVFGEKSCAESNIAVLLSGLRDTVPGMGVD